MFELAGELLVRQVELVLAGYVAQYDAGRFTGDHPEIGRLRELLVSAARMRIHGFPSAEAMRIWLHSVAEEAPHMFD